MHPSISSPWRLKGATCIPNDNVMCAATDSVSKYGTNGGDDDFVAARQH